MSIITSVPALNAIVKGVGGTFTLNKADVLALPAITADPYFSDTANWYRVVLAYRSSTGNQSENVVFDATQVTPTAIFLASDTALDIFEVLRIDVYDFDNGFISVQRADLTTAEFDVDMTPPPSGLYTRDFVTLNSQQGYEVTSGSSSSPLAFFPSGTEFTCAFGATNTYSNNDIAGFGLPNGTYKLKIYITSFSSTEMFRNMTLGLLNNGVDVSYNTLLANVGGFVEVTIVGSNLLGALYYLQGVNCTIGMSKIEILNV